MGRRDWRSASILPSTMCNSRWPAAAISAEWVASSTVTPRERFQCLQELQHIGPVGGIQVSGGLIRQKQQGVVAHRPRDADPLHLSSRELLGVMALTMEQAQALEQPGGLPLGDVRGYAVQHEGQGRVFKGGEGGQKIEGLKDEADLTAAGPG